MSKEKVFISGSIAAKPLPHYALSHIDLYIEKRCEILIGDAPGADSEVQSYLNSKKYPFVVVYHIDNSPRNKFGAEWKSRRISVDVSNTKNYKDGKYTRAAQMLKDKAMADDADEGFVIWRDTKINKWKEIEVSKGSLNNIYNLLKDGKEVDLLYLPENDDNIMRFSDLDRFEKDVIGKEASKIKGNFIKVKAEWETNIYYYKLKRSMSGKKDENTPSLID